MWLSFAGRSSSLALSVGAPGGGSLGTDPRAGRSSSRGLSVGAPGRDSLGTVLRGSWVPGSFRLHLMRSCLVGIIIRRGGRHKSRPTIGFSVFLLRFLTYFPLVLRGFLILGSNVVAPRRVAEAAPRAALSSSSRAVAPRRRAEVAARERATDSGRAASAKLRTQARHSRGRAGQGATTKTRMRLSMPSGQRRAGPTVPTGPPGASSAAQRSRCLWHGPRRAARRSPRCWSGSAQWRLGRPTRPVTATRRSAARSGTAPSRTRPAWRSSSPRAPAPPLCRPTRISTTARSAGSSTGLRGETETRVSWRAPTTPRCRSSRRRGAPAGPRARARRFRRLHHLRHRRSRSPPRRLWPWDPPEKAVDTIRFQRARRRHPRRLRRRSLGRMQTRR